MYNQINKGRRIYKEMSANLQANQPPGFPQPPEENNRSAITSTWTQVNKQISILQLIFKSKDY